MEQSTAIDIASLLQDWYKIYERRFKGDYVACDRWIDLQAAIKEAKLTNHQLEIIHDLYGLGFTQAEVAVKMGITRQAVASVAARACTKIANVYGEWCYGNVS